jgi:hypothetical protein
MPAKEWGAVLGMGAQLFSRMAPLNCSDLTMILPEPSQPVISVTDVKSAGASAKLGFHWRSFSVERIARLACQPFGGRLEMAEIIDDLGLAGRAREDEHGPLPIGQIDSVAL